MGNRLSKIVTRGGDGGQTSLGDGQRVGKSDVCVNFLGDVDELNSWIGVVVSNAPGASVRSVLEGVQHDLFDLGGALCFPGTTVLSERHVARLDTAIDEHNADLPPLKEFVLPGGAPIVAWLHVARTVCRRVERGGVDYVATAEGVGDKCKHALMYLNRLSDFLFVAARVEASRLDVPQPLWEKEKSIGTASDEEGG
ncbi:MAG: cob(I)yrinic acid a,c-diamide adenosyltransferase [Pseudomonadota bacterium]